MEYLWGLIWLDTVSLVVLFVVRHFQIYPLFLQRATVFIGRRTYLLDLSTARKPSNFMLAKWIGQ
jgi:hypothetical protein